MIRLLECGVFGDGTYFHFALLFHTLQDSPAIHHSFSSEDPKKHANHSLLSRKILNSLEVQASPEKRIDFRRYTNQFVTLILTFPLKKDFQNSPDVKNIS